MTEPWITPMFKKIFKGEPNVKVIDVSTRAGAAEFLFYETLVANGKLSGAVVIRGWCHSVCDPF